MAKTKILLGPAGLGSPSVEGIRYVKELGLGAAEVEFVRQVYMSNSMAKEAGALAKQLGISLSVHAPYYINLASEDKKKIEASKKRILQSCERAHYLGARYVVFHPAYYGKLSPEECYKIVKTAVIEMQRVIKKNKWNVVLCPETVGKKAQFGSVDELVRLSKETSCGICIDFAHVLAREGKIDYAIVLRKVKSIKHKTAHFSGIEYTARGERRHLLTKPKDIKKLLKAIKKAKINITIINESPDPIGDSLKTKKILESL